VRHLDGEACFRLAARLRYAAEAARVEVLPRRPDGSHGDGDAIGGASELEVSRYELPAIGSIWLLQFNTTNLGCSTGDRSSADVPVGVKVWPICSVVCRHLCGGHEGTSFVGARCLELGAGTGFLGVVLARLGAQVVVTDVDDICLRVAGVNARLNGLDLAPPPVDTSLAGRGHAGDDVSVRAVGCCACLSLEFGAEQVKDFQSAIGPPGDFDYIFAVDVLYVDKTVEPLFETVRELLTPGGCFFLGFVRRHKGVTEELRRVARAAGFCCDPPQCLGDGMLLYRFLRRGAYRLDSLD